MPATESLTKRQREVLRRAEKARRDFGSGASYLVFRSAEAAPLSKSEVAGYTDPSVDQAQSA